MNPLWRQLGIATNWPILAATAVLAGIGTATIWADAPTDAIKQLLFIGIGVSMMALFQAINYQRIGRWAWTFYIIGLLAVIYTIVPVTHVARGDNRFLRVPDVKRRPRLDKLRLPAAGAGRDHQDRLRDGPGAVSALPHQLSHAARTVCRRSRWRCFRWPLVLQQPDLGMALIFVPALFVMLFVAGARLSPSVSDRGTGRSVSPAHLVRRASMSCAMARGRPTGEICQACPHLPVLHFPAATGEALSARARVCDGAERPEDDAGRGLSAGGGRWTALGSGGPGGKGFGNIPVGQHVPEAHNDMIFALIGEQFGLFGAAVVLGAYLVLFSAGIEIAAATREPFGRLISVGIVAVLAAQVFINLGVCPAPSAGDGDHAAVRQLRGAAACWPAQSRRGCC